MSEEPIEFRSDGIVLTLSDGRKVRPVIEDTSTEEKAFATMVSPTDEYAKYTTEVDTEGVFIWFEEEE